MPNTDLLRFYAPFSEQLNLAEGKDLTSVDDIAESFVKYNKPKMSAAEIIGFVADFLSLGVGQLISKGVESAVGPMTKALGKGDAAPDYVSSQVAQYYKNQLNNYKQMGNQMAFEVTNVAGEYISAGKNLVEEATSMITEAGSFMKLMDSISDQWAKNINGYSNKLFNGGLSADGTTADGVSNFATLSNMLKDGRFSRAVRPQNIIANAQKAMYAQLIPIALHQNDDSRPTLIVRPYACDDSSRAKKDTLFGELFHPHGSDEWKNSAVTVKKYPKLCFFFVDANKSGAGVQEYRIEPPKQPLSVIDGMTHKEMTGDPSVVGGLTLDVLAQSIHEGFLKNGNKKDAFKIDQNVKSNDPTSLFDNELTAPGLYNAYFNECGNYNPDSDLDKNADMDDLAENIEKARDWSFADAKKGYPCIPGVKSPTYRS